MKAEYYAVRNDIRYKYVKRIENIYICNVILDNGKPCNTVLSINKKPSQLIRHFYDYHYDLYKEFMHR